MNAITNPAFRFRGTITLDMTQANSILSGTYRYDATFTLDGQDLSFVNGGTIAGAIAQGANPVIDLELTDGKDCLFADTMTLTGHHMTGARLMNLRGRIEFDNEECVWYAGFFHMIVRWFDTDIAEQITGRYHRSFKRTATNIDLYLDFEYDNTDIECEYSGYTVDDDRIDGCLTCNSDDYVVDWPLSMNIGRS